MTPMPGTTANAWKTSHLTESYLNGVRGAIPLAGEQLAIMLRLIAANGRPVRRFLDLGCGSGILAATLLQQYPGAHGVLLDFSAPMLAAAEQILGRWDDQLRFIRADYGDPGWIGRLGEGRFDVIVSGYSIHHQPDEGKRRVYRQIFDLLKPGGMFINIEHVASASRWVETVFDAYFIDALHANHIEQGGRQSREQVANELYYRPDKAANLLSPVELQCQWLREIGFQDVDCYFKTFELAVFGGRRQRAEGRGQRSGVSDQRSEVRC